MKIEDIQVGKKATIRELKRYDGHTYGYLHEATITSVNLRRRRIRAKIGKEQRTREFKPEQILEVYTLNKLGMRN